MVDAGGADRQGEGGVPIKKCWTRASHPAIPELLSRITTLDDDTGGIEFEHIAIVADDPVCAAMRHAVTCMLRRPLLESFVASSQRSVKTECT